MLSWDKSRPKSGLTLLRRS